LAHDAHAGFDLVRQPLHDDAIVAVSADARTLLTRDRELPKRRAVTHAVVHALKSEDPREIVSG
jgi:hypothetical protein